MMVATPLSFKVYGGCSVAAAAAAAALASTAATTTDSAMYCHDKRLLLHVVSRS